MVYVGSNDGFLHAFDASNGHEDWAYLPTAVVPNIYNLADTNYSHRYFVDGTITVGDVNSSGNWKTVLIGGLNSGGNAFYALDITDPTAPKAIWEFTDSQMGKSFGNPIITKLPSGSTSSSGTDISGRWVAILTSGYNNSTGIGILYIVDAYTGVEYFRIYTCTSQAGPSGCSGTSSSPSGLARINTWVNNPVTDNTSLYAYGGDLDGNLWRFDLKAKTAFKMAAISEPITVKPELALVNGNKVVYFGTGIFLQSSDRSDTTKRSIFGIKDNFAATSELKNVKTSGDLVKQTMSLVTNSTTTRTVATPAAVDWSTKSGWYVELLEDGERVNVDPKIQLGTLVVASNVPDVVSSATCTPGGHAWLNFLDIKTGAFIENTQSNSSNIVSTRVGSSLAVGVNVIKLSNGKVVAITTTADNKHPVTETPVSSANLPMKRVSWRELLTD
jgi:type IV pilus assembly protein PilY1